MKIFVLAASLCAAAFFATGASAQQTVSLSAGFLPDPVTFDVYSGGPNEAANIPGSSGCVGMVAEYADVKLNFRSNGGPLNIGVRSGSDTSLIIKGPDGWVCDDDTYGLNPSLEWGSAPSGWYEIWVGAVGDAGPSTVIITEGSLN